MNQIRIATWNVKSLLEENAHQVLADAVKHLDIVAIQSHMTDYLDNLTVDKFDFRMTPREPNGQGGVGFLINKQLGKIEFVGTSPRIAVLRIAVGKKKIFAELSHDFIAISK